MKQWYQRRVRESSRWMLCELSLWGNFVTTWILITALGWFILMFLSVTLFMKYYVKPTYDQWTYKSNPNYPEPEKVRQEIIMMTKGLVTATLCPALSLFLTQKGLSKAYCGVSQEFGYSYLAFSFIGVWVTSDFWEFFYHWCGHKYDMLWKVHKSHHQFYNPTPFAVIADEYLDQFMRALPMLVFPMLVPLNIDMLFFIFALFFYGYGTYLHWGYELCCPDAHHPWLNTSFQHYLHHALSIKNKPYHTGFFFKFWDRMFGSMYTGPCLCARCCREKGERTQQAWEKIEKPDYSVLLRPSFWFLKIK
eukprot:TRINITY_DN7683_c0_g1_i2.p1 TRINITY_DN7683_c0_g1~~TRINITY_DN7683_c0_g1_i2.p1  ORF type:complete len:306 (+),score=44.43 TRINITY_DN7683_c0_g1_i2:726-1643(+)